MNSLERVLKALSFQEPDRTPVIPILLLQGAKILKQSLPQYLGKAEFIASGQQALMDKYDHDAVFGIPHVVEDIEAFGGELYYHENASPTISKMAWRSWNDLDHVSVPNPKDCLSLLRTLKTFELLAKKFKGVKPIIGAAIAPFSLPSMLIGTEKFFELMFWEDELIREPIAQKLFGITKKFCASWCNAQLAAGADVVVLADGIASATCIMRDQFEKYALPLIQETIREIHGPVVYEPVGKIEPFIDLVADSGAKIVILEQSDTLSTCKKALWGKAAMMGNLNNIEMMRWNRDTTLQSCFEVMNSVGKGGGLILSNQGPEIPWDTPDEVIQAIVDSVKIAKKS